MIIQITTDKNVSGHESFTEPLRDLLLGRECLRPSALVVGDPVLAHVEAAPHRVLAQLDVVLLGPGQVLQHVAVLVWLDDAEVDLQPVVRDGPRAGVTLWQSNALSPASIAAGRPTKKAIPCILRSKT